MDSDFPPEMPCYNIDELVLENDFLDDLWIHKIKKKRVAGMCLGVNGLQKQLWFCKITLLILGI